MLFLGAQKGYPPWVVSPPQIKGRPPQLVNPSQPRWIFYMRASDCNQLSNELVQQLYQHCLIFPHPPRKYALATWHFFYYCYYYYCCCCCGCCCFYCCYYCYYYCYCCYCYYGYYYYYDDDEIWYAHIQVDPDKPQPKLRGHLEGTLYQCKGCAFRGSKPHYCQTHWFQTFFVGWLIMLGRDDSLSLQELCFH